MLMKKTIDGIRVLVILITMAATKPLYAGAIYAFGGGQIAVPSTVATGVIVSRYTFTPNDLCGKQTCGISSAVLYNKGNIWSGTPSGSDLETNVPGISTRLLIDGRPVDSRYSGTLSHLAEVQLFKDGRAISNGSFSSGSFNAYYILNFAGLFAGSASVLLSGSVRAINGTCTVPDTVVLLPPVSHARFSGVGSAAGSTAFNVTLNNCPAGFNRIGYGLHPLNGALSGFPGTLQPAPESTAAGIGIQLTDASGTAPPFDISMPLTNYNKDTGGSYVVQLRAAYLQTAASIRPGSITARMQVLLDYQ
ncbi:fimbrial protein [Burkholderia ambifaria]|uniref:fimbrial protein n=1 Tax=Burkholderia ambifaria TaxID=152480 RepID=UPI002FE155C6